MNQDKIPKTLRDAPNWVLWKIAARAEGEAATKLPFQTNGTMAKANDKSTWTTFELAHRAFLRGGYSGVGYEFATDGGICGIDLDGCRSPETGRIADWARDIIRVMNSYSEVSPSGTGVKLWLRGKLPGDTGRKVAIDATPVCDKAPAIEAYDRGRYFAVTGERLGGVSKDVEPRQSQLDELCKIHFPSATIPMASVDWHSDQAVIERARKYIFKIPGAVSGSNGSGPTFHVACLLVLDFALTQDQAWALLCEWNQTCNPPWSEKELQHKLKSASKQAGERGRLRNAKPERWDSVKIQERREPREVQVPEVRATTLEAATRAYAASVAAGQQKLVSLGIAELDYAIGGGVEFGEMVVMAARPSHGKSAVGLQCVHHATAEGMPACFISQEMSALALGKRTIQYASDVPKESWRYRMGEVDRHIGEHFQERAKCFVVENCANIETATHAIRERVERDGVRFAVVDYAQLLAGKGRDRYEQITATSLALRQLTSDTGIVLLALCQLNREIEKRKKFQPIMSDLRETGQFEQDADVILFVVWPHRLDPKNPPDEYKFYIAKNRSREINQAVVDCKFMPSRQMVIEQPRHPATWDEMEILPPTKAELDQREIDF